MAFITLRRFACIAATSMLGIAGAVTADPGYTQSYCSATIKSCLPSTHGTVTVYAYDGYDSAHSTPRSQSQPLGHGDSQSYFGCNYGICDFKFAGSNGKVWWVHDVCGKPTLYCNPADTDNCSVADSSSGGACP